MIDAATHLRCSTCGQWKLDEFFAPRADGGIARRRRAGICKLCKRKIDLRRFYTLRLAQARERVEDLLAKLKKLVQEVGPGRKS